ncbi:unnamed protein product [Rotaria sordida]|uniref:Uncharacterized protein n=1 Tax=Rotaria sordida TaxID=392033 RepID=A0A814F4C9_9BILA|nr:unnamed protein product [Rotaria sordida]CAF3884988.1 unnamed protein product [Rotaria sordida]
MATITHHDESLVERNEIFYSNTNMIDIEPFYKNFTMIQNVLQNHDQQKQLNNPPIHSTDYTYRANRIQIEHSSSDHNHSNELINRNHQDLSKIMNRSIYNLTKIVEDIGYNPKLPYIRSSLNTNNNTFSNTILKFGESQESSVNTWRSQIEKQHFSRWHAEKYQCSASMIPYKPIIDMNEKAIEKSDDNQSNIIHHPTVSINLIPKQIDEKFLKNQIEQIYGIDDIDTSSSILSRSSSINEINSSSDQILSSSPLTLKTIGNSKCKQQITIREYYPPKEIPSSMAYRSLSSLSSQQTNIDNEYEQFIHNHSELNNDPNPEIIKKSNPDHVTYKQNISVRYLIPPTPPPSGPVIIREIIPPRPPSPSPLIINHQDVEPITPSPCIFREAPPSPPPHEETKIITKVLPQEPPLLSRVIFEHNASLPPKPQSIIIEKWLPYEPPPPREIIYERIIQAPVVSEFQPGGLTIDRQCYHSVDLHSSSSSRLLNTFHNEQQTSSNNIENQKFSIFDQFAWLTQQQLEAIEHQTLEQIQTHQQWIFDQQQQQHMNMFLHTPLQLTTPMLIVNHPPVTRIINAYTQRDDVQQQQQQQFFYRPIFMYPSYR